MKVKLLSRGRLFTTLWTAGYQAPPSMEVFQTRVLEWGAIAHLTLFNFAYIYSFFLFLLTYLLVLFSALFPTWHLALVLFSSLCFSEFCSGKYNFWFLLFMGQYILFCFCWTVLILIMGVYVYVYIQSHFLLLV